MQDFIVAVDIGGSKILGAVLDRSGQILLRRREATAAIGKPDVVVGQVAGMITEMKNEMGLQEDDILGIGVGVPGPLDFRTGVVEGSPNLKWEKYPLREKLRSRLGSHLWLDKDTNAAVLGEYYYGLTPLCGHLIYVTVSSGVGGGIITDGQLLHGINGGGGEIGHMVVAPEGDICGCGRRGCLEVMASGWAVTREANALIARGSGNGILSHVRPGQAVGPREVGMAARQGDSVSLQLIERTGSYLGMAIANLVNIFNPAKIVLGGGMALGLQDLLLPIIQKKVSSNVFTLHRRDLYIEMTRLGEDIVLAGCAAMVLQETSTVNECNRKGFSDDD
ncbi:MAG TPA: ROK family protein [Syntrophomonas sp.]|nr:ROK family protein [Syntrophomonas sp.]HRW12590.1 ROK family protein [Syntrophomonas sp.]